MNTKSEKYSLLSSVIVIILSVIYLFSRIGFDSLHARYVFIFCGTSMLLLNLPFILCSRVGEANRSAWWTNELLVTFYLFAMLIGLSYISVPTISIIIAIFGIVTFCYNIYNFGRKVNVIFLGSLLLVILISFFIAGVCWEGHYLSPLFVESIDVTTLNKSSLDPLFHISIAQVIKNYGALSNGLHMLQPIKYHFLSHFLFARLSIITDSHMVYVYNIGYVLIFPPLLLKSFFLVSESFSDFFDISYKPSNLTILLLILGLTSLIPVLLFDNLAMRVWIAYNAHFVSESYSISIILMMCVINTCLMVSRADHTYRYFLFLFLPVLIFLITASKVSSGCLLVTTLGYLFLRFGYYRDLKSFLGMVLLGLIFVGTAVVVFESDSANGAYEWMHFYNNNISARFLTFIGLFFFWPLLAGISVLLLKWKETNQNDLKKITNTFEVIVIISIIGFIPASFVQIGGGSAVYFAEIQRWIGLIFVISITPLLVTKINLSKKIIVFVNFSIILIVGFNTVYFTTKALKHNLLCRTHYVKPANAERIANFDSKKISLDKNLYDEIFIPTLIDSVSQVVGRNKTYITLKSLMDLDQTPHSDKLIYIKDYAIFADRFECYHYFHFIPAFSGFAAFQGNDVWCIGEGYFFDKKIEKRETYNPQAFCEEIKRKNFKYLYKYDLVTNKYEIEACK